MANRIRGYGRRNWKRLAAIYVAGAAVVYVIVYFAFFSGGGGGAGY